MSTSPLTVSAENIMQCSVQQVVNLSNNYLESNITGKSTVVSVSTSITHWVLRQVVGQS